MSGRPARPSVRQAPNARLVARLPRPARVLLGLLAACVIGAALVAPVVLTGGSGVQPCAQTLRYAGSEYTTRQVQPSAFAQAIALGVGVASGCTTTPSNVDVRSIYDVKPGLAIALATDQSSIYVRRGTCLRASQSGLLSCLRTTQRASQ